MNVITQNDSKINRKFKNREKMLLAAKNTKVARNILLHFKTKQKLSVVDELFKAGLINDFEYNGYREKVLKEQELIKSGKTEYSKVIFKGEFCSLESRFESGEIMYYINQCGMSHRCEDLTKAVQEFSIINV